MRAYRQDEFITIEEFVNMIWRHYKSVSALSDNAEDSPRGSDRADCSCDNEAVDFEEQIKLGWLNAEDGLLKGRRLERRTAARIIHRFLLKYLGERDIEDISGAKSLKDLYDCRLCVNHVAQVYIRGIMEACDTGIPIFGMKEYVTGEQAEVFVGRLLSFSITRH